MLSCGRVYGLILRFWRLSAIPLRLSFAMKVCILRRSAVAERLSTKAVSDGFFTIGFLPALRRLFNSLIFLILSRSATQPWALRRIFEMGYKKR
jgi:hypothetical protein